MYGRPDDVDGECNAHLYLGDDYGDNCSTMRCQLLKGHDGHHSETFRKGTATITWEKDERCWHEFATCDHPDVQELDPNIFGEGSFECVDCQEFVEMVEGQLKRTTVRFCTKCRVKDWVLKEQEGL